MSTTEVARVEPPRIPYPAGVEERFGVDRAAWKALVEALFPLVETAGSIILALSYCKARNLDIFKRVVHIVPIWDKRRRCNVETVWPGIGELRTTAFRTGNYAGRDATEYGPDVTMSWEGRDGEFSVTFPEWGQVTMYRLVKGQRVKFVGPRVYWLESYATAGKSPAPNSMWQKRPRGQFDKCCEAASLRATFPEELGDELTAEESRLINEIHNVNAPEVAAPKSHPVLEALQPKEVEGPEDPEEPTEAATYEEAVQEMIQERGGTSDALFEDEETEYTGQ